jgi:uncharacterized protein YecE (DUF72 family)
MACDIRIGTSGWHYKHWIGRFYPAGIRPQEMFEYYARHFDTVELNNSFYKLPSEAAFNAWERAAPRGFIYAVKASRFLTHRIKLKEPERGLENLLPRVELLGRKLGPILFQLPPHWRLNLDRLTGLLQVLPRHYRYAFEFRDLSWHIPAVDEVLRRYNAAFCIYELAGFTSAPKITANFAYLRLHGPQAKYQGSYSEEMLQTWAERIEQWRKTLRAVYVYFDNDQCAYAVHNALALKQKLGGGLPAKLETRSWKQETVMHKKGGLSEAAS